MGVVQPTPPAPAPLLPPTPLFHHQTGHGVPAAPAAVGHDDHGSRDAVEDHDAVLVRFVLLCRRRDGHLRRCQEHHSRAQVGAWCGGVTRQSVVSCPPSIKTY